MQLPMQTVIPGHDNVGKIFESCAEDERHQARETILEQFQKAPDDIQWEIDKRELDEMIAAKKESSSGPDGITCSIYRCSGGCEGVGLANGGHTLFWVECTGTLRASM